MGVFELVARHFAFDDPGIGARAAQGQQLAQDFGLFVMKRGSGRVTRLVA